MKEEYNHYCISEPHGSKEYLPVDLNGNCLVCGEPHKYINTDIKITTDRTNRIYINGLLVEGERVDKAVEVIKHNFAKESVNQALTALEEGVKQLQTLGITHPHFNGYCSKQEVLDLIKKAREK